MKEAAPSASAIGVPEMSSNSSRTLVWSAVRRVEVPLARPALLTAGLLVFVDTMKELPATLIVRPFDFDTLAVQAHRLAADERLDAAAVPSLVIAAIGVLPVVLLCRAIAAEGRARRIPAAPADTGGDPLAARGVDGSPALPPREAGSAG